MPRYADRLLLPKAREAERRRPASRAVLEPEAVAGNLASRILALQRSAGNEAVTRVLARDAVVPLPGAGTQIIGDDDSDVTFSPWAKFEASNDPGDVAAGRAVGVQSAGFQSTDMPDDGGYGGTLSIKAGSKGDVRIMVKAHFFMDDIFNETFDEAFACSWPFEADLTGKVKFGAARPEWDPSDSEHARFQITAVTPNQDADSGMFQVTASFTGPQDAKASSKSGGITITPKDSPVGGGGTYERGTSRTFPAPVLTRTFWVKVVVTDIPPPPKHEHGTVVFGPMTASVTRTHSVLFARDRTNLAGEDTFATGQELELRRWYMALSAETRKGLEDGTIVPRLYGYASNTGPAPHNRILGHGRVESVEQVLRDFGVKSFDAKSPGEYPWLQEDPKQEVEEQGDRRVLIEVDEAPVQIAPAEPGFVDTPSP